MRTWLDQRGTALIEAAVTIPILLLIAIGIFEFGRAYQTWQILTNAAREGARIAVLPGSNDGAVQGRVTEYMQDGQLLDASDGMVSVNRAATLTVGGASVSASEVTVNYPYHFIVLQPVAELVSPGATVGGALTMRASATMRNETQ
jgi:Flp pilus assembly protein TadG